MSINVFSVNRLRCALICAALLYFFTVPVRASDSGIRSFAVSPYSGTVTDDDLVYWHCDESRYYLFLPAAADPASAKVYYSASDTVELDGAVLEQGQSASALTEGEHTLTCGENVYPLTVLMSSHMPAVFIVTQSGSLDSIREDKTYREAAAIRIYEDGKLTMDKDLAYIKMRGNSSTIGPKIPFTIRFKKKTDMFGMGKAKKWTILANRLDLSLLHDDYAWELAKAFGLHYSSDYRHVDLYINGSYLGNYVICERIESGPGRIEIRDLEKENKKANRGTDPADLPVVGSGENGTVPTGKEKDTAKWVDLPNEPEDISGGYLLEFELASRYNSERAGFVTKSGLPIVIREPENAGMQETAYIRSYVSDALDALYSPDGRNEEGRHYTEYFDLDSFVNMYILQELSNNIDSGLTSFFMIKAGENEKLVFSPIWDMDLAFGSTVDRFEVNISSTDIWWSNSMSYPEPTILTVAYRHDDFREAVCLRWARLLEEDVFTQVIDQVRGTVPDLEASGKMNVVRWLPGTGVSDAEKRYASDVSRVEEFIQGRVLALTKGFSKNAAMLYYDANGGFGEVYNRQIFLIGEPVEVIGHIKEPNRIDPPDEAHVFAGWNTEPDGSGETYQPGDTLVCVSPVTFLYAVWKPL